MASEPLIDQRLQGLLVGIGIDPEDHADAFDSWCRLRTHQGPEVNVIDLYALVAHRHGLKAHKLPIAERRQLAERGLHFMVDGFEIIAGSDRPERDPIELVAYDEKWPHLYADWRSRLAEALGSTARRIEHVGSTAVMGLSAKPVIDIQISVGDLEDEPRYVPQIEALGVQLRSRDPEHRFFRPFSGLLRGIHIHLCAVGSEWERRHLLFRDYLRADPASRDIYLAAKRAAAERWRDDRIAYTEAKDESIRKLMAAAEAWAGH